MENYLIWSNLFSALIAIACGCALPVITVWLITRQKANESKDRTQIVLAAIEKNPDLDIEELMKKITPKRKLLKEKLLAKLLWGCITAVFGIGLIVLGLFLKSQGLDYDEFLTSICFGVILLGVGGGLVINYGVGKKMLAKEIETEQNNLTKQK